MEVKHSVWFVTQRNVLRGRHSPIKLPKEKGWVAELVALPISLGEDSISFLPLLPNQHDSIEFEQYWLIVKCVTFSQINAHGS
jgi:hypothetical protein